MAYPLKKKLRPAASNKNLVAFELRVSREDHALINEAAKHEAARLGLTLSRNNFIARAVRAASKAELGQSA